MEHNGASLSQLKCSLRKDWGIHVYLWLPILWNSLFPYLSPFYCLSRAFSASKTTSSISHFSFIINLLQQFICFRNRPILAWWYSSEENTCLAYTSPGFSAQDQNLTLYTSWIYTSLISILGNDLALSW